MAFEPLVSIIIPTYRLDFCRQAVHCVLAQTYQNTEIVLSDNSDSCDIQDYVSQFKKIKYVRNADKSPLTTAPSNISNGLRFSRGDYIKFLFDDDLIFPHTIAAMVQELAQTDYNKIGIVTSHRQVINDWDRVLSSRRLFNIQSSGVLSGARVCEHILTNVSNIIGEFSTMMFNRIYLPTDDPMQIYNFGNETYHQGLIDVPIYINILRKTNLLILPYELSAFRKHEKSGSNMEFNPQFHYAVTDWLRLINTSYKLGILPKDKLKMALTNYNKLESRFRSIYPEQIEKFAPLYNELSIEI